MRGRIARTGQILLGIYIGYLLHILLFHFFFEYEDPASRLGYDFILDQFSKKYNDDFPIITAYLERYPPDSWVNQHDNENGETSIASPLPSRRVFASDLTRVTFPTFENSKDDEYPKNMNNCGGAYATPLPIVDNFPGEDPYLPWIHDLFPSDDGTLLHLIAQNRRQCDTGESHVDVMKQWEGQVSLFQSIAVRRLNDTEIQRHSLKEDKENGDESRFRLASHDEASSDGMETRFLCRFKSFHPKTKFHYYPITLSQYPFNYEYVNMQKGHNVMFHTEGKENSLFWLSQLQFDCPIPSELVPTVKHGKHVISSAHSDSINDIPLNFMTSALYVDIIPIRTPVRGLRSSFLHSKYGTYSKSKFDPIREWGRNHILPKVDDSGRWENLPICLSQESLLSTVNHINNPTNKNGKYNRLDPSQIESLTTISGVNGSTKLSPITKNKTKPYKLVACTWTSALHNRRGDARTIYGGGDRLKEWITFHLMVGFDHIVVYDNTGANIPVNKKMDITNLTHITNMFPRHQVTHVNWPHKICNNNRPMHPNPGERSSQYAAESSCLERFGPRTEWMASMDIDEYFVPMGEYNEWKSILNKLDKENLKVLKFRSTVARLRLDLAKPYFDDGLIECGNLNQTETPTATKCVAKSDDVTFLRSYNCDYIKSPKPERFQRAMKQIYRPDYVLSHYVHYSTVTTKYVVPNTSNETYAVGTVTKIGRISIKDERFIDEINEGVLIHARTRTPDETAGKSNNNTCKYMEKSACPVGVSCPDDLPFEDNNHKNGFIFGNDRTYCNCWVNRKVENYYDPLLISELNLLNLNNGKK